MLFKDKKFRLVMLLLLAMNLVIFGCKAGGGGKASGNSTTVAIPSEISSEAMSREVSTTDVASEATNSGSEASSSMFVGMSKVETTTPTATIESSSADNLVDVDSHDVEVVERFVGAWYPVYILDKTRGGLKIKHPFQVIVVNRDSTVSVSDIGEDLEDKSGNGTGVSKYSVVGDTLVSIVNSVEEVSDGSGSNNTKIIMSIQDGLLRFQVPDDPTFEVFMARDRDSFDFSDTIDPDAQNN